MKKIFGLIAALALLTGCDDGDMNFKTFDFSNVQNPTSCTNEENNGEIHYKVNGSEALILQIPEGTLKNVATEINKPVKIAITGTSAVKIFYREYNKSGMDICAPKIDDIIVETWTGTGTISVVTTQKRNPTTQKLEGYDHAITLENITFTNGDESITVNNNLFGTIKYTYNLTFDFINAGQTEPGVGRCETSNLLYTLKGTNGLEIHFANFDDAFQNINDNTKSLNIANTDNLIYYTVYDGTLSPQRICDQGGTDLPNPVRGKRWQAISGTIEIKTVEAGGQFIHSIYLKGVTFGNRDLTDETFLIDDIAKVTTDGYFFGKFLATP